MNLTKEFRNEKSRRFLAVLMIIALLFSALFPVTAQKAYAASDGTITLKVGRVIDYSSHFTHYFYAGDKDNPVYCAQPQLPAPQPGTYEYKYIRPDSMLAKCLYYGYGGPGFDEYTDTQLKGQWDGVDDAYALTHIVISIAYDKTTSSESDPFIGLSGTWKTKATNLYNYIKTLPDPPVNYKAYRIKVSGCQDILGSFNDTGAIRLAKSSADPSMTDNNSCYSLAGAKYGVYYGDNLIGTITTGADGTGSIDNILVEDYTIREISASKGYAIDAKAYNCTVKNESVTTVTVKEQPKDDPIGILLEKGDLETGLARPQGGAKLSGAVYEIKYYKHYSNGKVLDRTWRVVTNENGIAHLTQADLDKSFANDDLFYSAAGDPCIPLGTVTVQEITPPEGYLLNDAVYETEITEEAGKTIESVYTYNVPKIGSAPEMAEQVKRGDLEFVKVADGTLERLAGVPFKITSLTTGESHTVVSDKNGYVNTASSWNSHTSNTNRGKTSEDGIWFGTSAPDDEKGALIYDRYEIEELSCEANEGMNLLKIKVDVYKDAVTVFMGTLTDDIIEISTAVKDEDTDSHLGKAEGTVYIKDTVKYSGLKKGSSYTLKGTLMNQETGEPVMADGKPVTAETVFTAKSTSGEAEVEFKVPSDAVKGKAVVVFEELYLDGVKLAAHEDIEDAGQTVYYPDIRTSARDRETASGVSAADDKVTLTDTVSYSGLMPGKEYKVSGTLMDKATGKPVETDGNKVTSEAVFTADKTAGTVDVTFEFSGKDLAGKTTVVFETLEYRNREIAVHADLFDDSQTVYFPEIGTKASDSETGTGVSRADDEVTVIDTVMYQNLRPGLEYRVAGVLVNKKTGEKLMDGDKEITAEAVFIPGESSGSVDVTFTFSAVNLKGQTVVAFESLYYKDIELAVHADINDKDQSITFPEIATTARDDADGDKVVSADKKACIADTVKYEGLAAGEKYTIKGVLMDKETGKPVIIDGRQVTAEKTFKADKSSGSVEVKFTFNAGDLAGKELVVFEKLFYGETELASHEDISDKGQTVRLVKPEKPETPVNSSIPKTGDTTDLKLFIAIALATLLLATCLAVMQVRNHRKEDSEEAENEESIE